MNETSCAPSPRALGWALALGLWLAITPAAEAQAAPAEDRVQARSFLVRGKKLLRQKRYRDAVRSFQQAYRFWQRREIQFNLALAYLELGDKVAAGRHLRRYLHKATPAERQALPGRFVQLQRQIGLLRVQSTTDPRVEIWIDGQRRGTKSVAVVVLPGPRAVELRRGSRVLMRKVIQVDGGREVIWNPPPISLSGPRPRKIPPPPVTIRRTRRRRIHWALFTTVAALAVCAGAATLYTGIRALQLRDEWRTDPSDELKQKVERHELATNVLIGVAATAAAGAVVLAFFTRWRSSAGEPPRSLLMPVLTPGGAGLSFRQRF